MASHRGQGAFGPLSENPARVNAESTHDDVIDDNTEAVDEIGSLSIASATHTEQQAATEYGLPLSQVPYPTGRMQRSGFGFPSPPWQRSEVTDSHNS